MRYVIFLLLTLCGCHGFAVLADPSGEIRVCKDGLCVPMRGRAKPSPEPMPRVPPTPAVVPVEATPAPGETTQLVAARAVPGCKRVIPVKTKGYIYKNSAPLRGASGSIVGYRYEPTLIMDTAAPNKQICTLRNPGGRVIGTCPWASAHGAKGGRCRCTMKTAELRKRSIAVNFQVSDTTCINVPDVGKCYGSVKGPCKETQG